MSAPGTGAGQPVQEGAVPAGSALEVGDAAFAAGAPLDQGAEGSSALDGLTGWAGWSLAGDDNGPHAEGVQVGLDAGLAVATVGGHRGGWPAGPGGNPGDGRGQLWRVGRIALLDGVVDDDAVGVVHHLGLVAELDRLADAAPHDRAGVTVVQADHPGRGVGHYSGQSRPRLGDDDAGDLDGGGQL